MQSIEDRQDMQRAEKILNEMLRFLTDNFCCKPFPKGEVFTREDALIFLAAFCPEGIEVTDWIEFLHIARKKGILESYLQTFVKSVMATQNKQEEKNERNSHID